jgi:hypothetical protein
LSTVPWHTECIDFIVPIATIRKVPTLRLYADAEPVFAELKKWLDQRF